MGECAANGKVTTNAEHSCSDSREEHQLGEVTHCLECHEMFWQVRWLWKSDHGDDSFAMTLLKGLKDYL